MTFFCVDEMFFARFNNFFWHRIVQIFVFSVPWTRHHSLQVQHWVFHSTPCPPPEQPIQPTNITYPPRVGRRTLPWLTQLWWFCFVSLIFWWNTPRIQEIFLYWFLAIISIISVHFFTFFPCQSATTDRRLVGQWFDIFLTHFHVLFLVSFCHWCFQLDCKVQFWTPPRWHAMAVHRVMVSWTPILAHFQAKNSDFFHIVSDSTWHVFLDLWHNYWHFWGDKNPIICGFYSLASLGIMSCGQGVFWDFGICPPPGQPRHPSQILEPTQARTQPKQRKKCYFHWTQKVLRLALFFLYFYGFYAQKCPIIGDFKAKNQRVWATGSYLFLGQPWEFLCEFSLISLIFSGILYLVGLDPPRATRHFSIFQTEHSSQFPIFIFMIFPPCLVDHWSNIPHILEGISSIFVQFYVRIVQIFDDFGHCHGWSEITGIFDKFSHFWGFFYTNSLLILDFSHFFHFPTYFGD